MSGGCGLRHAFYLVSALGAGGLTAVGITGLLALDEGGHKTPWVSGECKVAGAGWCACASWEGAALDEQFCTAYRAVFPASLVIDGQPPQAVSGVTGCDLQLEPGSINTCRSTAVSGALSVLNISAPTTLEQGVAVGCTLNLHSLQCAVGYFAAPDGPSHWKFTALVVVGGFWLLVTFCVYAVMTCRVKDGLAVGEESWALTGVAVPTGGLPGPPKPGKKVAVQSPDGGWEMGRVVGADEDGDCVVNLDKGGELRAHAHRVRDQDFSLLSWVRVVEPGLAAPVGCLGLVVSDTQVCLAGELCSPSPGGVVPAAPIRRGDPVVVSRGEGGGWERGVAKALKP
eukprot:Hpha_TRINITY_DN30455_c0_g1::TRINITY_DN30455_c0_g1_i1::g.167997::m.167997